MPLGLSISSRVRFIGCLLLFVLVFAACEVSYGTVYCLRIPEERCESPQTDPDSGGQSESERSNCYIVYSVVCVTSGAVGSSSGGSASSGSNDRVDEELVVTGQSLTLEQRATAFSDQSWLRNVEIQATNPFYTMNNPPNGGQVGDGQTPTNQTDCPVSLSGLKKIEVQEDWSGMGEMPLRIERTYISHPVRTGKNPALAKTPEFQFGLGWRANFDKRIDFKPEANCRLSSNAAFSVTTGCTDTTILQQTEFRIHGRSFTQSANPSIWVQSPLPDENASATFGNNQFVVAYSNGRVEKYDIYGRMLSTANLNGVSQAYQYLDSTTSRIASITHSSGQSLVFNWSGSRLASINTPEGQITYQHETITETGTSNYLLTKVIFPGSTGDIGFDYDYFSMYKWNRLTKVRLNGEIYKEITHSNIALQNVETSGLAGGVQRSTLTIGTNKVTVTNALGATTVYEYDTPQREHLVKIDRAGSTACPDASAFYGHIEIPNGTGEGNIKYVKWKEDWTGNRTTYSYYDPEREILETEYANGRTIKYEWDGYGRPLKKTWWDGATSQVDCTVAVCARVVNEQLDAPLKIERFEYHSSSGKYRLKSVIEEDELGNQRKTGYTYTFYSNNLPSRVTIDGPRTDVSDITEMEYDAKGRLTRKTNALGQSITYTYSGNWEKPARITDANGMFIDFSYDARGRVTAETINGSASLITQYRYNRFGKVDLITHPNGTAVNYHRDAAGRLVGIDRPPGDPALFREVYSFAYDNLNNLLQQSHGYVQYVTKTIYTPGGPVTVQEPQLVNSTSTRREYDSAGNLLRELGNNGQVTNYTYTPNLKVQTIRDALNRTTRMDYTGSGLLDRITRPDNTQVNFDYDPLSRLTDVTDPRNKVTKYRFDQGFTQARTESPDTRSSIALYNSAGLVSSVQREDGTLVSYQYDVLNRLESVQSNGANPQSVDYDYDLCANGKGRLCQVTDNSGSTQYSYTVTGKVASKTQVIGGVPYVTSLTYDANDRFSEVSTNNGGARLRYSYDINSEVNKVEVYLNGTWISVAEHKARAQKRTLVYSNILHHVRDYDLDGRLTKITVSGGFIKNYSYDAANRITRLNGGAAGDYYYQYDSNDRLTKELYANSTTDSRSYQYAYDANGNRTSRQQGASTTAYTIDANSNRLLSAGSTSYAYTSTGNLSGINNGQRSFSYDGFNRLRTYNHTDGSQGAYTYNFANQRVLKTARVGSGANETIRYLYSDSGQLLAETLPNSSAIGTSYIWFRGEIVGFIRGGTLYQVLNDHLGRPEAIYRYDSSTRILVWQAKNLAFAREVATNALGEFNIGLPGQYYDKESGLWYNWHRYYDASIGRYIQSDPIGLEGGFNTYTYVKNNPTNSYDPYGLFDMNFSLGAGGGFQVGPIGLQATTSLAADTNGRICVVTERCAVPATGIGIFGVLGISGSIGTGSLCEGDSGSAGVFLEGGAGIAGSGSISTDGNGVTVGKGIIGIGGGGGGGIMACSVRTFCFN